MGRPINKKYLKGTAENPIKILAKFGDDELPGIMYEQIASKRYVVKNGIKTAICQLVDKDPGALLVGEMTITGTNADSDDVRVMKLLSRKAMGNDDVAYRWGFDAPTGNLLQFETFVDGEEVEAPIVETDVPANPDVTTPGGTLLAGEGNPSTNFATGSNNELEINCRIGYYNDQTDPVVAGDTYTIDTEDEKDWNWSFTFYLAANPMALAITDLYDVSLHITSDEIDLTFELEMDELRNYHFKSTDGRFDIIDGYTNDIRSIYQNIQRINFYDDGSGQPVNAIGAPIGTFNFDFIATRKTGVYDPVELNIIANVT